MPEEMYQLMKLQCDIRVKLLRMGVPDDESSEIADEVLHIVAMSTAVRPELKECYVMHLIDETEVEV